MSNSSTSNGNGTVNADYLPFDRLRDNKVKFDDWIESNLQFALQDFARGEEVSKNVGAPRARWLGDEKDAELQQIPEIFKRQDQKTRAVAGKAARWSDGIARAPWLRRCLLVGGVTCVGLSAYFLFDLARFEFGMRSNLVEDETASSSSLSASSGQHSGFGMALAVNAANARSEGATDSSQGDKVSASRAATDAPEFQSIEQLQASSAQDNLIGLVADQRSNVKMPEMLAFEGGPYQLPYFRGGTLIEDTHTVTLDPFELATHEVSRADWQACVLGGACSSEGFEDTFFDDQNLDLPMTAVTLLQISDYLDWLNSKRPADTSEFRLPSDAEWVVAARGGSRDVRRYAWEGAFNPAHVSSTRRLVPVKDTKTINGLAGIVGNAEERTSECWMSRTASGACYRGLGIVRGAPLGDANGVTSALTFRSARSLDAPYSTLGFRLAR